MRHRERLARLRAALEPVGEPRLVARLDDGGFHLVAHGDAQLAVLVGELGPVDPGLALAADVDKDVLGRDVEHAPFDNLPDL